MTKESLVQDEVLGRLAGLLDLEVTSLELSTGVSTLFRSYVLTGITAMLDSVSENWEKGETTNISEDSIMEALLDLEANADLVVDNIVESFYSTQWDNVLLAQTFASEK